MYKLWMLEDFVDEHEQIIEHYLIKTWSVKGVESLPKQGAYEIDDWTPKSTHTWSFMIEKEEN